MYILDQIEIHAADHCVQKCKHCSHAADIAPKRFYSRADYEPGLSRLQEKGIVINRIQILGGEPFLNPELGELALMARQYAAVVLVMSNMYWLKSEADLDRYAAVLRRIDHLVVTLYDPIVQRCGGIDRVRELLDALKARFPHLVCTSFTEWGQTVKEFGVIDFHADPLPIVKNHCNFVTCKNLLPDMRVLGCCSMLRIPNRPEIIDAYDLKADFDPADFLRWYNGDKLKTCNYCSVATKSFEMVPWELVGKP